MNGVHDLGGLDGFGPVPHASGQDAYRRPWELRAFALAAAGSAAGLYGGPEFRHAIERIPPARYLASAYYERWTTAVATLLVERGVLDAGRLAAAAGGAFPLAGPVRAPHRSDPGPDVAEPRFARGDRVRVRNDHPQGHTRCPRYVRGRQGLVVRVDGPANFDDAEAHSDGRRLDPLYCVRFDAAELWGSAADVASVVHVDLFDAYLDPAP